MVFRARSEMEGHPYSVALRELIEASCKHSAVAIAHDDLKHEGLPDDCSACGPLRRSLMVVVDRTGAALFASMRDFADKFGI